MPFSPWLLRESFCQPWKPKPWWFSPKVPYYSFKWRSKAWLLPKVDEEFAPPVANKLPNLEDNWLHSCCLPTSLCGFWILSWLTIGWHKRFNWTFMDCWLGVWFHELVCHWWYSTGFILVLSWLRSGRIRIALKRLYEGV